MTKKHFQIDENHSEAEKNLVDLFTRSGMRSSKLLIVAVCEYAKSNNISDYSEEELALFIDLKYKRLIREGNE